MVWSFGASVLSTLTVALIMDVNGRAITKNGNGMDRELTTGVNYGAENGKFVATISPSVGLVSASIS